MRVNLSIESFSDIFESSPLDFCQVYVIMPFITQGRRMNIIETAQRTAREIRTSIGSEGIPAVAHTVSEREDPIPTREEIWKEIEERWAKIIARELEVAYAAGKRDGKKEAEQTR